MDNVALVSADLLEQVNRVIVAVGHEVAGRQPGLSLAGRSDSFAAETDVKYPTDASLLRDAVRCLIRVAAGACEEVGLKDWRKRVALQLRLKERFNAVRQTRRANPAAVRPSPALCLRGCPVRSTERVIDSTIPKSRTTSRSLPTTGALARRLPTSASSLA